MNNIDKILQELKSLDKTELKIIILDLLTSEKIKYEEISKIYVHYLEIKEKKAVRKESLFANCLASAISGSMHHNKNFFHSQAYVLLKDWLSDTWINKNLKNKNNKDIKRNKKLLEL